MRQACCGLGVVQLDVIGTLVALSEREAEELRAASAADAGRSSARRDLALLLERALRRPLRRRSRMARSSRLPTASAVRGGQDVPKLRLSRATKFSPGEGTEASRDRWDESACKRAIFKSPGMTAAHAKSRRSFAPLGNKTSLFAGCFQRKRRDSNPRPPA